MRDDGLARRSHDLLKRAVEIDSDQRDGFIQAECSGNAKLLARVRSLLKALENSTDFLEAPALARPKNGELEPDASGEVIAGYRIVRVIGQGGMARVYEAIQDRPHRRVALKVMNRGMTQTSAVQRFLFETEVLARLRHPNIAQIHEAGSFDDGSGTSIPYFAMEYIPGARPVTAYSDEKSLNLTERLAMFVVVCHAVQHGHQNGIIHRDLKPANVLIDATGQPKVIDFGIARSTDPEQAWITRHSDLGQLIGTLNYMSPEQCAGSIDLDVRADVYSLGIVLFELVCGRLPYDLTRFPVPEALRIVQLEPPPRPSAIKPALRGDLEAIILKAVDKDPNRRYSTPASLSADIERFLRSEAIEARPPTLMYQARLFARRHRPMVVAAAAILISLLAAVVLSGRFAYLAAEELQLRKEAQKETLEQRDAAVWRAYVANIFAANSALRFDELQHARRNLSEAPEVHRNWEWRYLHQATERSAQTIAAHEDQVLAFAISPDESCFATGSRDGIIHVWDSRTRAILSTTESLDGLVLSVALDHGAARLVSGSSDRTVRIWDARTGLEIRTLGRHRGNVGSVAFGADDLVATASSDGTAILWDAGTGKEIRRLDDQPGGVHGVAFSRNGDRMFTWNNDGAIWVREPDAGPILLQLSFPGLIHCLTASHDGRRVAAGGSDGRIMVWNLEDGSLIHSLQTQDSVSAVRSLAFTPNDEVLASGQGDRSIRLWSMATGLEMQPRFQGHEETVSGLAFTPDGFQLVSASWDRTLRVWEYAGPGWLEPITTLHGHEDRVITTRFSPDESLLASSSVDGTVRLWDPELGTPIGTLRGHEGAVFGLAFSPDGRYLASGANDNTVRIWNMRTAKLEAVLEGHTSNLWSVAFSPDGRYLASAGNDAAIRIWDLPRRQTIAILKGHTNRVTCVRFSPDGKRLASASRDHTVRMWDLESNSQLWSGDEHRLDVYAVLFTADGSRLFSGCRDQTVREWDPATGKCLRVLDGHGQFVTCLSLSPSGDRLAAGSWYGEVVMWDLKTLDVVISFKAHNDAIRGVEFGPSGRWLASASYDQTVRIFDDVARSERLRLRDESRAKYDEAALILDGLVAELGTIDRVTEVLDREQHCDAAILPWVRKLALKRHLE